MTTLTWQDNLTNSIKNNDVVVLYGNIRDRYVLPQGQITKVISFKELVTSIIKPDEGIFCYDPFSKVTKLSVSAGANVTEVNESGYGDPGFSGDINVVISRILEQLEKKEKTLWMLYSAHNILPYKSSYDESERLRLIAFQRMIEKMKHGNKLILCYLSDTQVPLEFSENMPKVAFVKIPEPEIKERQLFWIQKLPNLTAHPVAETIKAHSSKLSLLTDGFAISSLEGLYSIIQKTAPIDFEKIPVEDWENIVKRFKFGSQVDYFGQIPREDLENAFDFFVITEGITGQDQAVTKVIEMLWRARTNVAALLDENSNAPKGVLFFAGPSGVGKTMLAKKLAKFIFKTEESFLRFDMSEYYDTHTVSRLIGAPPGYVGFEEGGVLTNKVKEKPFSVILFDEIEKAHAKIFDIFLQILSDGRLTDSRGQTVYFSETVIIFTSNIGTESSSTLGDDSQEERDKHFLRSVQDFFRYKIGRPELLGRIGNNIIPFSIIENDNIIITAVNFNLDLLENSFNKKYKEWNLALSSKREAITSLIINKYKNEIKELGIREVINIIKDKILTKLAQNILLYEKTKPGRLNTLFITVNDNGELDIFIK